MLDLWTRRAADSIQDLPLGPGDELTISVPEVDEIQNQHVRISPKGTITLPLIGTLEVARLSEVQAQTAISDRLAQYMKHPRVELYAEKYRSRGVAVIGAVQKPGLYDLANPADTLSDMIGLAGGVTTDAAQLVTFVPAVETGAYSNGVEALTPVKAVESDAASPLTVPRSQDGQLTSHHISISLATGRAGDEGCLGIPARSGDVIVVLGAGDVTVEGWVRNPGSFKITRGMTILGAVTAAGGALFSWKAELLRTDQSGSRVVEEVTLNDLESGSSQDLPVEAGDVVLVEKSIVGAVPYSLLMLFQKFGTGLAFPVP
jgi:polysaccharide export outer membrane protein